MTNGSLTGIGNAEARVHPSIPTLHHLNLLSDNEGSQSGLSAPTIRRILHDRDHESNATEELQHHGQVAGP